MSKSPHDRDFLTHLEAYLAKRDGVDKLLKISRYASKILLASSLLPQSLPLSRRLKSFESSVGLSRKAFRLGKFVQDLNALRSADRLSLPALLAYAGEGLYYFLEQFVWLAKSGLIDARHLGGLQKLSSWAEFVGYFGSIALKFKDLGMIAEAERRLESCIEISMLRGNGYEEEERELGKVRAKKMLKKLSIVQDFADGWMAFDDIRGGKGVGSSPLLIASAGLLSAIISTHKNWLSC